jgi:histidinol-phosphate/aromatic aminotransferase/cobyric acid decarboxylase-like protein
LYPNAFYHVTCRGNDRRVIFRDDHDRARFLEQLRSASEVFHWLLKEGVIVRPMTSFGMESALRVTIGTPEENRRFVKALKKVLAGAKGA